MTEPAVRFEKITRRFPGVQALTDVSLEIAAGSCHALCGENGAGKSTLGKILAGIHTPDAGRVFIHGREVQFESPRDALAAGVGMVHQELAFCENLSVAENLCLGSLPSRGGLLDRDAMASRATAMLAEIGTTLDVWRPVGSLTIAQQQMVQIAMAVSGGAKIIIFDEPTSSLSQVESDRLYELIGRLKQRGVACIYVSHRMPEVFKLCDTVSVLRDGQHVGTRPIAGLSEHELVQMMIGRPLAEYVSRRESVVVGDELLRAEGLSSPGKFEDVSFSLRAGEVLGIAGLVGAGRSELAQALFGLDPVRRGTIVIGGQPARVATPAEAIALGIGLVPEDRKRQGLVPQESGVHNLSLAILKRLARFGWLRQREERRVAKEFFDRLRVRAPSLDTVVAGLSGGNQQKIVLARWLAAASRVLILDEPTRGVDVGAKAEIHALIGELANQGAGILLISSELPEVLTLSQRILVLRAGRMVGEVPQSQATQDNLLRLMAGLGTGNTGDWGLGTRPGSH
ncbi:MAG TPA: sugar ABC transporter ATP-binding protein [Gemmatimonadaceae bacterium]|nr:sugar ABC transporter ATP-binding protein [Gemmatimonadaceae bacterium]